MGRPILGAVKAMARCLPSTRTVPSPLPRNIRNSRLIRQRRVVNSRAAEGAVAVAGPEIHTAIVDIWFAIAIEIGDRKRTVATGEQLRLPEGPVALIDQNLQLGRLAIVARHNAKSQIRLAISVE